MSAVPDATTTGRGSVSQQSEDIRGHSRREGGPGVSDAKGEKDPAGSVHRLMPLAIVLVSVITALAGLRASVSDEHATDTQELSRQ